jgi:integrase
MATFKRGKTWWTDFAVNGVRYRMSLGTTDWREALSREKDRIAEAQAGKLSVAGQSFARLAFTEALRRYLEDRSPRVARRSHRSESDHAKPLREFFDAAPVARISSESVLDYIRHRKTKEISNVTINMEIGILRRVLKRAKRWSQIADDVPRLPERRDVGRAMSPDEKLRLLRVAWARPEWETARLACLLALNTTMRGCELKGLRWCDVDLLSRALTVRRSKTAAGERVIPLNSDAMAAVLRLRERAKAIFGDSISPDWYVLPHAEGHSKPDPTRPMSDGRSAWRNLTRAVECPPCGRL